MTPIELEHLHPDTYTAMVDYAVKAQRAEQRARRQAERKSRRG